MVIWAVLQLKQMPGSQFLTCLGGVVGCVCVCVGGGGFKIWLRVVLKKVYGNYPEQPADHFVQQ